MTDHHRPLTRQERWRRRNPWHRPWEFARRRCQDQNHSSYAMYGGRGIEFHLTKAQAKMLFERDNGAAMEQPSLDRIDPDGHYTVENCRFIEYKENCRRKRYRMNKEI